MGSAYDRDRQTPCETSRSKHNSSTLDWLKAYTIPLFSANHNAIAEWAKQIPWQDVAEEAFVEKPPRDLHEHCWLTSEKSFS